MKLNIFKTKYTTHFKFFVKMRNRFMLLHAKFYVPIMYYSGVIVYFAVFIEIVIFSKPLKLQH